VGDQRLEGDGHTALLRLATEQHGVVTTAQLSSLGYSKSSAAKAASVGRLVRLHRGVYAVGHGDLGWNGHCLAAALACSPCVASHWSAAWLWGLLRSAPSTFHLTARLPRHGRDGIVLHSSNLAREDLTRIDRIPVTSVERTVLDLTAVAPERTERFLEKLADRPKGFDRRRFESLLGRTAGHPGHVRLKRELELYRRDDDPAFTRSRLEKRFRRLLRDAGMPMPAANVFIGKYELDCWWEEERLAVELDTFGTHGSRRSFEADRLRQRELGLMGIAVERVTDRQLESEAGAVLDAIRARLAERAPGDCAA
jgi:very-short-patch-repair endonuclease